MVSTPAWDGTGCEFDSWQCRIYIPCSLSLRLLGSLRGSLGTYGLTQKNCVKKSAFRKSASSRNQSLLLRPRKADTLYTPEYANASHCGRVLRAAARLILLLPRTSSVDNQIRTVLHWLGVPARVTFKLCLLAHRCLHGSAPPYLIRYFTPVSSIVGRSHLRSTITGMVFGPLAFTVSSPSAWNSLPVDLRDPGLSLLTFRRRLKTYLFNNPG